MQGTFSAYGILVVDIDPGHCLLDPLQREPPEEGGDHLVLVESGSRIGKSRLAQDLRRQRQRPLQDLDG